MEAYQRGLAIFTTSSNLPWRRIRLVADCPPTSSIFLRDNKFVGKLPADIRNLTALTSLDLSYNYFTGGLPTGMGQLEHLALDHNSFTGEIPAELLNSSTLVSLGLNNNALSGYLPNNMCHASLFLQVLFLSTNHLVGVVPSSLSNLQRIDFSINKFTAFELHLFSNLPFLQLLLFSGNNIRIELSSFITSLTNCRSLSLVDMGDNPAYGIIPPSIGNLSSSLQFFFAYNCQIKSSIPPHRQSNICKSFNY